ncbi:TatD family hydrolase [Labrys monachus]|uniref:TatD DNase family protein n=1 Tax=Labrys monachus TaxID=217067 RepID=A0ABU0FEB5_9HYPH|nr:TatD family hydrolase [Labrys monachus]MDQ0392952.1 TatD DNase family protein [Labrys monachus]
MVIDSHCHLDFPDFESEIEDVVARARSAGVARMITISTRIRQFEKIRALIERFDDVYGSVGTHCLHAAEEDDVPLETILSLASHPKVVAIGEAGLDYHYDHSPRDVQARGFRKHIAAARQTGLPLVIHARQADDDIASILEEEMGKGAFTAVLHCFSSGGGLARRGLALGFYVSFSGILTFKTAEEIREVARFVPHDRLLVETDAPYLAPVPFRGKRNEPAYVVDTARVLAETIGVSASEIGTITTANAFRLFSKMPRPDGLAAAA